MDSPDTSPDPQNNLSLMWLCRVAVKCGERYWKMLIYSPWHCNPKLTTSNTVPQPPLSLIYLFNDDIALWLNGNALLTPRSDLTWLNCNTPLALSSDLFLLHPHNIHRCSTPSCSSSYDVFLLHLLATSSYYIFLLHLLTTSSCYIFLLRPPSCYISLYNIRECCLITLSTYHLLSSPTSF